MKWAKQGGIIPTSKYPYLDGTGYCVDHRRDAVGFVDTPMYHDFRYGNADYIKYVLNQVLKGIEYDN
jgi:hypothetical protein